VGTGLTFQSRVKADDGYKLNLQPNITDKQAEQFNPAVEFYFKEWCKKADSRLVSNFFELQRLVMGALIRDGEVLAVGRKSNRKDRLIPYCIDLYEIDRLMTPIGEINNPKITGGIEFDDEGAPLKYYISKVHPGSSVAMTRAKGDFYEIDAYNQNGTKKVMHLFNPVRPEQIRGFSELASSLKDIQDMDRYREAEIYSALEDACLTGFVTTENPAMFQQNYTEDAESPEYEKLHEFAPGKFSYLRPGEDIKIHSPNRPNSQFGEMVNQLLRGPSNALDIPPEVLSQNWQGMNYSNARTVLIMFYLSCRIRQQHLIDHFCSVAYESVARELIAKGLVPAEGFQTRSSDYLKHIWIPCGWQWIDPVKEAKGKEIEMNNNFETLTSILAGQGKDFEETMETRAMELKKIKELEEKHGVKMSAPPKAPGNAPQGDQGNNNGDKKVLTLNVNK
jgi:lambda family phage portal protein